MIAPKLRFSEFKDEWQSEKLGKVIDISSASRVFKEQWQESGIPFFRTSDVVSIFKNTTNEKAFISNELYEELAKKSGKIQKDDLLITGGGSIGIPYLVKDNKPLYFKDADVLWLKSSGKINGSYLYNFFVSPKFREYLKSISHTGTISHFTIEQAKMTPIVLPSIPEQTKIAEFLSVVDDKISQLSRQLELLNEYKKGVMQKIFSQEIRFKNDNGEDFGEWEEIQLKDIFTIKAGGDIDKKNVSEIKNSEFHYPIFANSDRNKGFYGWSNQFKHENAITVTGRGNLGIAVARNEKFFPIVRLLVLLPKETVSLKFFEEQINQLNIVSESTGVPQLTAPQLSNYFVLKSCYEEQKKIAEFLTAIDERIEHTTAQLTHTKQWKKGLLQQMFV